MLAFFLALSFGTHAQAQTQPIPPASSTGVDTSDTSTQESQNRKSSPSSSGRIIPPDEFGKFEPTSEKETDLSQVAIIEKLRADSASMRIRYEERLRQLRSDSQAMRATIQKLRKQVRQLKRADRKGSSDTESERDTSPMLRFDDQKIARSDTNMQSDNNDGSGESTGADTELSEKQSGGEDSDAGPGKRLNPNTASLSELKSISELSDRLAERIEWYRREVTPFEDLQDLRRVPGIDRQTFKQIQDYFHEGPY